MRCCKCGGVGPATYVEACAKGWEKWSSTRADARMVCPECVASVIDGCLEALRIYCKRA